MNRIACVFLTCVVVAALVLLMVYQSFTFIDQKVTKDGVHQQMINLTSGFSDDLVEYLKVIRYLRQASSGDSFIVLTQRGGYTTTALPIIKAIQASKAEVMTQVGSAGWAFSYGAIVTMYGKTIKLRDKDTLSFHAVWFDSPNMISKGETNMVFKPIRSLFTDEQWSKIYAPNRPIVRLTGKEVCAKLKTRVKISDKNYCIMRGFTL